jgi:hypothetical protein
MSLLRSEDKSFQETKNLSGCYTRDSDLIQIISLGTWPDALPSLFQIRFHPCLSVAPFAFFLQRTALQERVHQVPHDVIERNV